MEMNTARLCFHALAGETRLLIFRLLVQKGPSGLPAGEISEALSCPHSTLSFHLKALSDADLIRAKKQGRSLIYAANFEQMNALMTFLTENCCQGEPCSIPAQHQET